jgi:hypothetical protein
MPALSMSCQRHIEPGQFVVQNGFGQDGAPPLSHGHQGYDERLLPIRLIFTYLSGAYVDGHTGVGISQINGRKDNVVVTLIGKILSRLLLVRV